MLHGNISDLNKTIAVVNIIFLSTTEQIFFGEGIT